MAGLLHRVRRRRARSRLSRLPAPRSVLVVCDGNLCRSPYAASALRKSLPPSLHPPMAIWSAGLSRGAEAPPPEAVRVAAERGVDLATHRSRPVTFRDVGSAQLIVVMAPHQEKVLAGRYGTSPAKFLVLGDLDPAHVWQRIIVDPIGHPEAVFRVCYDRIDRCIEELVGTLYRR